MTNEELWQAALGEIELSISRANFSTWFKNTSILSNDGEAVVIGVPNGFAKEWLENKYNTYIIRALQGHQSKIRQISCSICNIKEMPTVNPQPTVDAVKAPIQAQKSTFPVTNRAINTPSPAESNLNHRYVFESFIVGENNELAKAACYAVSQNLGRVYNPLFIYGGVGLGKTHLLQSIGNEILKKDPGKVIKYTTMEKFATELVDSIKNQTVDKFKSHYQKIDLLIIDDVQFLSGREKTQHEFFHIFNALYQLNKQIVISSDRPPKSIATLEERLRSRFEGGMIADISQPDLETRMAILRSKALEKDFSLDDEVVRFITENIKNNIRELEGALNRVIASCQLTNTTPNLKNVKQALSEIISSGKRKNIQHSHVIRVICDFYEIKDIDLINKGRRKEVVKPRQMAMYLLREELNASYPGIGELFGGRDHTTALHAYEKISREIKENEKLAQELTLLKEALYKI